ncbi:kinase/pyrophosphorylase, partial [Mycobacterium tuberculosis]|nr:kinase/pyrophosphorylase [Mycobacterium tuberculosis]
MPDVYARTVFFISDGTGITAETLGHSLLTQFEGIRFRQVRIPFVTTLAQAQDCLAQIQEAAKRDG